MGFSNIPELFLFVTVFTIQSAIQNLKKLIARQFLTHFCGLPIKIYDFVSLKSSSLRMKLLFKAHYFIGLLFKNIPTLSKNTVHVACLCAINRIIVLGTVLCVEVSFCIPSVARTIVSFSIIVILFYACRNEICMLCNV